MLRRTYGACVDTVAPHSGARSSLELGAAAIALALRLRRHKCQAASVLVVARAAAGALTPGCLVLQCARDPSAVLCLGEVAGELGAGADAELAVDAGERRLDAVDREDEFGGDLAVGETARDELSDPLFGRRQGLTGWRAPSDAPELGASLAGP